MRELFSEVISEFRLGKEGGGSAALARLTDVLSGGLGEQADPLLPSKVLPLLNKIIAAQQRGDHLCVADVLEYELWPLLNDIPGAKETKA